MTLNTARKIEWAFNAVTVIVALPFAIIGQILEWIKQPFGWVLDGRSWISHKTGHWLMQKSDAVKGGTIKNPYILKHYTARLAWELLREAEKDHREENI